jgi:hypothetical protein
MLCVGFVQYVLTLSGQKNMVGVGGLKDTSLKFFQDTEKIPDGVFMVLSPPFLHKGQIKRNTMNNNRFQLEITTLSRIMITSKKKENCKVTWFTQTHKAYTKSRRVIISLVSTTNYAHIWHQNWN